MEIILDVLTAIVGSALITWIIWQVFFMIEKLIDKE